MENENKSNLQPVKLATDRHIYLCPKCDGILIKNTSPYAKDGTYTCNGKEGHYITVVKIQKTKKELKNKFDKYAIDKNKLKKLLED